MTRQRRDSSIPYGAGNVLSATASLTRGTEYLTLVQQLAIRPEWIYQTHEACLRIQLCHWIGSNIDAINAKLLSCLEVCYECFHIEKRRSAQILAAPITQHLGLDALCNILVEPFAILVDVGRVVPQDWINVVAHEYAHAYLGCPGHDERFLEVISHLCLGLGLEPPPREPHLRHLLRTWPQCRPTADPLAFWLGLA